MQSPVPFLQVVHAIPGRLRVRIPALRGRRDEVAAVAFALAQYPGVVEVRCHPFTGSFLVLYDERHLPVERLIEGLRDATGAREVVRPGELLPLPDRDGPAPPSAVGRAVARLFHDLNADLLRATGGGVDLGVLMSAALVTLGGAEVVATRRLPPPPWFNLAWWSFQSFMNVEGAALRKEGEEANGQPRR